MRVCLSLSHSQQVEFSLSFFRRPITALTLTCASLPIQSLTPDLEWVAGCSFVCAVCCCLTVSGNRRRTVHTVRAEFCSGSDDVHDQLPFYICDLKWARLGALILFISSLNGNTAETVIVMLRAYSGCRIWLVVNTKTMRNAERISLQIHQCRVSFSLWVGR